MKRLPKNPRASLAASSYLILAQILRPQLTFVWVVGGEESLNLELVRQGCVHPATQTSGDSQKLEVSQTDYDAFVNKVTQAASMRRSTHQEAGVSHRSLMIQMIEEA